MMVDNRYLELLEGYTNNTLTLQELEELKVFWKTNDTETLNVVIEKSFDNHAFNGLSDIAKAEEIFNRVMATAKQVESFAVKKKRVWFAAAAVIAFFVSMGGLYLAVSSKAAADNVATLAPNKDIQPGNNKAVLTLANGTKLMLNDSLNGIVAKEGSIQLVKSGGELSYRSLDKATNSISYNTICTPRGGMYELVLADGTKVWLDAASSLKYPASFVGNERKVELTGEAYFEVAHNKNMPFRVIANQMTVEVLGTHFNINAYTEEAAAKTTLIEGAVKVSANNATEIFTPGKMASYTNASITVADANIEEELAWKNGYFIFNKAGIATIMRQLSRWYDVEVSYEGTVPQNEFVGQIKREETLVGALKILELSGMHFRIEGRKVIVLE